MDEVHPYFERYHIVQVGSHLLALPRCDLVQLSCYEKFGAKTSIENSSPFEGCVPQITYL